MDNKPLEKIAEDFIKLRLGKAGLRYLKPNYDTDGTDLVILNALNKHYARQVIVQSKGRNLTELHSNVKINKDYVVSNFVCFLYLQLDNDPADYAYIFFADDIRTWKENNGVYELHIPKAFKQNPYFVPHEFDPVADIGRLKTLLDSGPIFRQSYVEFEKMQLVEVLFELWKKYGSFPDLSLTKVLYDQHDLDTGSYSQDLFLLYIFGRYADQLENRSLDVYMHHLYEIRNITRPIAAVANIKDPDRIERKHSLQSIAYPKLLFGEVDITYDGIDYRALYSYIGDREDHVEAAVFDNGEFIVYGERKGLRP